MKCCLCHLDGSTFSPSDFVPLSGNLAESRKLFRNMLLIRRDLDVLCRIIIFPEVCLVSKGSVLQNVLKISSLYWIFVMMKNYYCKERKNKMALFVRLMLSEKQITQCWRGGYGGQLKADSGERTHASFSLWLSMQDHIEDLKYYCINNFLKKKPTKSTCTGVFSMCYFAFTRSNLQK